MPAHSNDNNNGNGHEMTGDDWVRMGQNVFKASRDSAKKGIKKPEEDLKNQQFSYDTFAAQ